MIGVIGLLYFSSCFFTQASLSSPLQPLSQYLSSKLAAHPIGIADRGYLKMLEALVVWLPVYLCPLHCPVNAMANAPAAAPDCPLRYKSLGRLTKPTSPYSCEIAAKALRGALGMARISRGASPIFDSHSCPLFPNLFTSSALSNL